ncbi:MAG: hypothetical protein M1825_002093 [Sarcosagium campestre]|nr:MAG: hypothetical protein M1825_002093 [Sarcosagium campestre]
MASNLKSDRLNLNYIPQLPQNQSLSGSSTANTSPVEPSTVASVRSSFGNANGLGTSGLGASNTRLGAGSPSHEMGGRLFSKRAREIQAQERLTPNLWGPPTSGNSTPLRENIPESPTDGFPDFSHSPPDSSVSSSARRARAGTVPSRFSPGGQPNSISVPPSLSRNNSRPTPTGSPFKSHSPASADVGEAGSHSAAAAAAASNSALLSRLRSGSMPQRNSYVGASGPFGPTLFSSGWANVRADRSGTITSIGSTNGPSSPAHSSFSKDGVGDNEMRTLDYLGLADTPQPARATLARTGMESLMEGQRAATLQPYLPDLAGLSKSLNRFRSYSVNAKEKYAEEEDEELGHGAPYEPQLSGSLTPSAASAAAALAATQAQIHQHNLAVQAFANQASASRPRARTAGVLESPPARSMRSYLATPSRLDNSISAADMRLSDPRDYEGLPEAVQAMQLNALNGRVMLDGVLGVNETSLEGPTRALWLGSIPSSTTVTSLNAIFNTYGKIESTRVLTHKNCGFVNFEHLESAIQARTLLNGKEIFPGAGPVRIGYAKVPDSSGAGTPGQNGAFTSPSPDPTTKAPNDSRLNGQGTATRDATRSNSRSNAHQTETAGSALTMPLLQDMQADMVRMVGEFGTADDDKTKIVNSIDQAIQYDGFESEIASTPEPGHSRIHDAPKLRDIRKRIDNNACTQTEIEEIAIGMLPEIAELSSDYLGNTVVQKLFEFCSEAVKLSMLTEIAPHLAEIGVHKNGTWAAQKIIDVAKSPAQMSMVVESLRPYTVSLFLDQYGNYVLQCVLRFGAPWNNFIFETMLSRMWDVSQGRFGARAMRACLESHHATKDQQRMLAAAIALNSVQLSTNANGALLLTWFLDTCTFPNRRTVLAPRLVPHLVHLCTHKVAYLTVLKVINQRNEPEARDVILKALFFTEDDVTLESILSDASCGATLIFKVLTTPFFEESMRAEVVQNVRTVLLKLKAQPGQGYKRLMDEVGLSTRTGGGGSGSGRDQQHQARDIANGRSPSRDRQRPSSQQRSSSSHTPQPGADTHFAGRYAAPASAVQFDPTTGLARSGNFDSNTMSAFDHFGLGGMGNTIFTQNSSLPLTQMTPQQLQYQQALLAASATRPMAPPQSFYPTGSAFLGAPSQQSMDPFRATQGQPSLPPINGAGQSALFNTQGQGFGSPLQAQQGFGPILTANGYQYPGAGIGMQYLPQQQMQQEGGGHRKGRVSF